MYSPFNTKHLHIINLITIFSLFMFISCEHEIPIENQVDTTPPASVKILNATAGDKTVFLSWSNPSDNDFYGTRITFTPSVSGVSQPVVIEGEHSNNSSTVFNGLKNDIEYTFSLVALDKNQNKSKSVSIKVTPKEPEDTTPPKEVTELKAEVCDKSVTLTWINPDDIDLSNIQISFVPEIDEKTQPITIEGKPVEISKATIEGLKYDTEYTFTLKTQDKKKNQSKGNQIKVTPTDTTPPEEVKDITVVAGDKSISLTWLNPSTDDFESTEITFTPESDETSQPVIIKGENNKTSTATINNLKNEVEYTFTLKAIDKKQNHSQGVQIKTTPSDNIPPENIKNLTAVARDKSVFLSWTNPNDSDFERIQITFTPEVTYIPQPLIIHGEPDTTCSTTISGLPNDTTYTFMLTAFDKSYNKSENVTASATPKDITPPAEVTNISATTEDKSVTLFWTNPSDADFVKNQISFTPEVEGIPQPIYISGQNNKQMNYTISGLQNETEYTFVLKTLDNKNNISEGQNIKTTPKDKTPSKDVSDFTLTPQHNRITLRWKNPSDVDFYGVEISSNPAAGDLSHPIILQCNPYEQKELTILNLENGIEYDFTIKTIDTYNNKSEGIQKKATPQASTLLMSVTLPNDNDHITITNDTAPIKVTVSSSHEIKKAVWKKREPNDNTDINTLINNPQATSFNINTTNSESIINVSENGIYDIAVRNAEGIDAYKQVEIKTIDKNALPAITNLSINCDGTNINISWTNPVPQNTYDAQIQDIIISSIYNDDNSDTANSSIPLHNASIQNYSFKLPNGKTINAFVQISIKTIDAAGNESEITYSEKINCGLIIVTDIESAPDKIKSMKTNGRIIITGEFSSSLYSLYPEIEKIKDAISALNKSLRIDLDFSKSKNLTYLPSRAFTNCTQLTAITIPESVEEIGTEAFKGCTNLSNINFPNKITVSASTPVIQDEAFSGCTSLSNIVIPEGITQIGAKAFSNCTGLSSIVLPDSITRIGAKAFSGCSNLSRIELPNKVTESTYISFFGTEVFSGCTSLSNIIIPEGITSIDYGVFYECTSLTSIVIPEDVKFIGKQAFYNCKNLSRIDFPNSVTEHYYSPFIGIEAFSGCSSLSNIVIPEGAKRIADKAFYECTSLTNIVIPDSLEEIGEEAFAYSNISKIDIPGSVKAINKSAFYNCSNLSRVTIADGMTSIASSTFAGCSSLSNIKLPNSLTEIKESAFKECKGLENIEIPSDLKTIGNSAFEDCSKLSSITLPEGITSITSKTFCGCTSLQRIGLPKSLTNIDESAFWDSAISNVYYNGTLEEWCTKLWNPKFFYYGYDLYINNKIIEEATIPEGLTHIGAYAFYNCISLKSVILPEGMINLDEYSFADIILENIVIPKSLTHLESTTFWYSDIKNIEFVDKKSEWSYSCKKYSAAAHDIVDYNGTLGPMNEQMNIANLIFFLECDEESYLQPPVKLFNQNYIEE